MGRFSQLEPAAGSHPAEEPALSSSKSGAALSGSLASAPPRGGRVVRPKTAGGADDEAEPEHDGAGTVAQAEEAYFLGDWDKALRLYSRAIQLDASLTAPWVGQVYALLRKKQYSEALTWANRALEVFPEHPSLLSVRGVVYSAQGMTRRAIGASDYALSRGGTPEAWLARGEILLAAGNSNALACFDKAMESRDADDWKTPMRVGMALADRKKFGAAFDYYQKAIQRKSNNPFLWHEMGRAAERLRFREQAAQAYERARQLDPDNGRYKRSLELFQSAGPFAKLFSFLRGS